jgi:hypothetical protein
MRGLTSLKQMNRETQGPASRKAAEDTVRRATETVSDALERDGTAKKQDEQERRNVGGYRAHTNNLSLPPAAEFRFASGVAEGGIGVRLVATWPSFRKEGSMRC